MMDINLQNILRLYEDPNVNLQVSKLSKEYLENFWLSDLEFHNFWLLVKNNIFLNNTKGFPDLIFNKDFKIIIQRGGLLFTKEEFNSLKKCMMLAGDKYFVILESEFKRKTDRDFPHLRFKYPVDITWEELNNGANDFPDISYEIFYLMNKSFFIFGDSGKWGKYSDNNYDTPLDILGFKPELLPTFLHNFTQSKVEKDEIKGCLPENYKKLIIY